MDPNRWLRIEEIFNEALNRPIEQRESFLQSACAGDNLLHDEVTSLINEVHSGDNLLSEPVFEMGTALLASQADELLVGQTLGVYTLTHMIGRGGMGEVYLAQDQRLRRRVALKLLPKALVQDEDRVRRFEHEARAASAISHPNVAHIYEIGEAGGRLFTAMEFVDGITLRERIGQESLAVGEAFDIAMQVARAIAAAHAEGIIHRDIKPENILIRRDGLVKVVDFGLAKLTDPLKHNFDPRKTQSGARETRLVQTEPGLLLGTATYMSPEQARGHEVDARTDLWSWGVVFFEILMGHPPFAGATSSDVIAEILKTDPALLTSGIPTLPTLLTEILRRSLTKERSGRYTDASALLRDLQQLSAMLSKQQMLDAPLPIDLGSAEASSPDLTAVHARVRAATTASTASTTHEASVGPPSTEKTFAGRIIAAARKRTLALIVVAFIGLSLLLFTVLKSGIFSHRATTQAPGALNMTHLTNDGRVMDGAISRDALLLAYVPVEAGKQSLHVRNLETGENWELLPPDPALCWGLRFAPNNQSLFYITTQPGSTINVLYRMPVHGGVSQKLVVNIDSPPGLSPDGTQIAFIRGYPGQQRDALIIANNDGSAEREILSRRYPDKLSFAGMAWSPDSKLIAVGASRENETQLAVLGVPLNGGTPLELTPWQWAAVRGLAWQDDGRTLILSAQTLGSRALQIWRLSYPELEVKRITNDEKEYEEITLGKNVLLSNDTYEVADVWVASLDGNQQRITSEGHEGADGLRVTSGGRIIYTEGEVEESHLWSMNLDGSDRKLLTKNSGFLPSASRDGQLIAYVSTDGGGHHVWLVNVDGQNNHQLTFGEGESYPAVTADGQSVVYASRAKARGTLWKIPTIGGQAVQLTYAGIILRPVMSPDGSMIACTYRLDETDKWKIAILPSEGGEPTRTFAVPYPYNQMIRWTPDGKALTYLDKANGVYNLWRQPINGSAPTQITNFTDDSILHYDWLTSGQQMVLSRGGRRRDLVLMKNFD